MRNKSIQIDMNDRVVIVTGGTRGMGLAISKTFVENGVKLLAVHRSDTASAKSAADELKEAGKELMH